MAHPLRRIAAVVVLLTLVAVAFALPATAGGKPYDTALTGTAERPDPGDPDATGSAHVTVNPGKREVCWSVEVQNVDLPLVAAHIHSGISSIAGPPVIFLIPAGQTDADGVLNGCATTTREIVFGLLLRPDEFYVNVHTALFQPGAARGQLG
jgi:hypothetical protein